MDMSSSNRDTITKASSPVKLGIGESGSPNNSIGQGSYKGSGLPGTHPGSLNISQEIFSPGASLEEDGLDVGASGSGVNVDPLRAAWANFIDQVGKDLVGWDWFATFTFRDPENTRYPGWTKPGWKYAHRALRTWAEAMMSKRLSQSQPYWLALMEYQYWRGVPHWHILVGNTDQGGPTEERRMDWVDWWWERYGIARILPYEERLGAKYYLGKYLTKQLSDVQRSPQLTLRHRQRWRANAAWLAAMTSE